MTTTFRLCEMNARINELADRANEKIEAFESELSGRADVTAMTSEGYFDVYWHKGRVLLCSKRGNAYPATSATREDRFAAVKALPALREAIEKRLSQMLLMAEASMGSDE